MIYGQSLNKQSFVKLVEQIEHFIYHNAASKVSLIFLARLNETA